MDKNEKALGRVPPQNLDAEVHLLGSILIRPEVLHDILTYFKAEHFYAEKHRIIFKHIQDLLEKNEPIDLVTVSSKLRDSKSLDGIGGIDYLTEIAGSVGTSSSADFFAKEVFKKAVLRDLIRASNKIGEFGFDEVEELDATLEKAEKEIYDITQRIGSTSAQFVEIKNTLEDAWARIEKMHESKGELRGVTSGYKDLDNLLSGFQKSDLIILAARPSVGKTSLALDFVRHAAVHANHAVAFFSLEMSKEQLVDRMVSAESKVNSWKLRTGSKLYDNEWQMIQESLNRLKASKIFIDDEPAISPIKLKSKLRKMNSKHKVDLVVVDYLQLMSSHKNYDSMVNQVTEISRSLKGIAKEFNVPVIALSQLSRAVETRGGKPKLSDLRDSGCLTGDTLVVNALTGERHTMKELSDKDESIPVFSVDEHLQIQIGTAIKFFSSGRKKVFEMKLRSGRSIKASANHKFKTIDGWKRLDELETKEHLIVPRALTPQKTSSCLSHNEIRLLAHLLGDGCILPRQPYHYTTASELNKKTVVKAAKELFGIEARIVSQGNWEHIYLPSPYKLARGKNHPITTWFKRLGIERVRSYEKKIPSAVFTLSNAEISYFLKHLWSTDGNLSYKNMTGRKTAGAIYYASSSKVLAKQVSHLLLRLSIHSKLRSVPSKKYRTMYHVVVEGKEQQLKFLEMIGINDERKYIIPDLIVKLNKIKSNTNIDIIPREAWRLVINPEMNKNDLSWRGLAKELGISYNGTALQKNGIGRDRMQTIATILKSPLCMELATSSVLWDEIVSIEPLGIQEVFDATVPGYHNFIADDILVHNSIEQDADVVMFIHREDYQKNSSERTEGTSETEILIEKHRNGPTGYVKLHFDKDKTTFNTIDRVRSDFANVPEQTSIEEF